MKTRRLGWLFVGLGALGGGALLWQHVAPRAAGASSASTQLVGADRGTAATPGELRVVAAGYDVKLAVQVLGAEESSPLELNATLRRWPLSPTRQLVQLRASSAQRSCSEQELAQSIVIETDAGGAAQKLHLERPLTPICANVLRQIVAALQVALPATPAAEWQRLEWDSGGELRVSYRSEGAKITKRKLRYERVWNGRALAPAVDGGQKIIEASSRIDISADGGVERVNSSELAGLSLGDSEASLRVATTIKLTRRADAAAAASPLPALPVELLMYGTEASAARTKDAAPRQARPIGELLSLQDSEDLHDMVLASLRSDPGAVEAVRQRARSSALARSVLTGLAAQGSDAAQRVIGDIVADASRAPTERRDAMQALAWTEQPNQASLDTLSKARLETHPELQESAVLSYGTAIHQLTERDPATAQARTRGLVGELKAATGRDDVMAALLTLGNAGSPDGAEATLALAGAADPAVRAAAYRALRLIPGSEVDNALIRGMTTDPEIEVRQAALAAASMRPIEGTFVGLTKVCHDEQVSGVRADAVAILGQALEQGASGDVLQLLHWLSEHDPDPELRGRAAELLKG